MFSCLFSLICIVFMWVFLWFILGFFLIVCLLVTVKWLAVKTASEITYTTLYVGSGVKLYSIQFQAITCTGTDSLNLLFCKWCINVYLQVRFIIVSTGQHAHRRTVQLTSTITRNSECRGRCLFNILFFCWLTVFFMTRFISAAPFIVDIDAILFHWRR